MIRACANCFRHTLRALVLLIVLPCVVEVGLRVYVLLQTPPWQGGAQDSLVESSEHVHHQLRPLQKVQSANPDTGQPIEIVTNSFGLRGAEWTVPKPPGTLRIVCLGDENVLGPEMPEEITFPARLQSLLQQATPLKVEVVNAGVPGYCPLLSYLQVRHRLLALQPDLLILNFDMSDVAEGYQYRRHTVMDAGETPLACLQSPLAAAGTVELRSWTDQFLVAHWCKEHFTALWTKNAPTDPRRDIGNRLSRYAWLEQDPPDWSVYIQQTLLAVDQLRQLADGIHARLILATYPAPWQVSPRASGGPGVREEAGVPENVVYTGDAPFQILTQYGQSRGLTVCNAAPTFRSAAQPERLYLENAPRFSELGNDLYAQQLAQCVATSLAGPWRIPQSIPSPMPTTPQTLSSTPSLPTR